MGSTNNNKDTILKRQSCRNKRSTVFRLYQREVVIGQRGEKNASKIGEIKGGVVMEPCYPWHKTGGGQLRRWNARKLEVGRARAR